MKLTSELQRRREKYVDRAARKCTREINEELDLSYQERDVVHAIVAQYLNYAFIYGGKPE